MLTRRTTALRRQMQRDDSGFSLIEVVVAMVVLLVFAGALSVTLLDGLSVSKVSRQRVAASNLAARELEIVRNKFSSSDAGALAVAAASSVTNGNPLGAPGASVVDGVPYTVQRDVQWLPTGTGVSACDGGALVNSPSLQVFVTVTWPNMRNAKPVRAETVMTPLKGQTDDLTVAFIAVKVQNADGTPAESVTATATGPGGTFVHTTDASGCAVFQVGTAGTYNVTLNMAGWVDQTGTQLSVKTPIVAAAGTLVTKTMTYDSAASMNVTLATDVGYAPPVHPAGHQLHQARRTSHLRCDRPSPPRRPQPSSPVSGPRRTATRHGRAAAPTLIQPPRPPAVAAGGLPSSSPRAVSVP